MDSDQLTESAWFDDQDGLVVIAFDRLTISMQVEEFLDFFYSVDEIREKLESHPMVSTGTYENNGVEKETFVFLRPEDEYN